MRLSHVLLAATVSLGLAAWLYSDHSKADAAHAALAAPPTAPATTGAAPRANDWPTYADARNQFHLQYPPSWKVNAVATARAHYTDVLVSFNSAGTEHFTVREQRTSPSQYELNEQIITQLIPVGTAYLDVSWQEGPGGIEEFGPNVHEMDAADLSGLLKDSKEEKSGDLITRDIVFQKWGRCWVIGVTMHAPVTDTLRADVTAMLASFRFDGLPKGNDVWALGQAWKKLPPEASPEKFTRQGGSTFYNCRTKIDGDDVLVTFSNSADGKAKNWVYRVTPKGEVTLIDGPK